MKIEASKLSDVIGKETAPLVKVRPWRDYQGQGDSKTVGTVYEIMDLADGCDKLAVKVPGEPIIGQEELNPRNIAADFIVVGFEGFTAREYTMDGRKGITAKADRAVIVSKGGNLK